jgi:ABC-type transport system involved in multi-copper enzyme maturation permease subunit
MIRSYYIIKSLRDHLPFLILAFILVGALQTLLLTIVTTTQLFNFVRDFVQQLPQELQQFLGEEFVAQFSVKGAAAFGYNHPLVITFLAIVAITLPSKHIAGEIENGTQELVFSMPVRRISIGLSLWLVSFIAIFFVIAGGWLGTFISTLIFPDARLLPFSEIFLIGISLGALILCINAYTFLISSYSREGSKVALQAAGVTLFFYFLNSIAKIWSAASFLKPYSIFYYYEPQNVMMGEANFVRDLLVLGMLTILLVILTIYRISRRDIP